MSYKYQGWMYLVWKTNDKSRFDTRFAELPWLKNSPSARLPSHAPGLLFQSCSMRSPRSPTMEHPRSVEHNHAPTYNLMLHRPNMVEKRMATILKHICYNILNHLKKTTRKKPSATLKHSCCNILNHLMKLEKTYSNTIENVTKLGRLLHHQKTCDCNIGKHVYSILISTKQTSNRQRKANATRTTYCWDI